MARVEGISSAAMPLEPLGNYVLRHGRVEISAPVAGLPLFSATLSENLLSLDQKGRVGRPATATSDPERWTRGLLLLYNGSQGPRAMPEAE